MKKTAFIVSFSFALLFGQGAVDTLKFSHQKHIQDAGLECLECHTNAPQNTGGGKTNHPNRETCKKCHEDAFNEKNCNLCHTNSAQAKPFRVELHHKNFSHSAHLKREVKCAFCHKDVNTTALATEKNLPDMKVCASCHNDKQAPGNCTLCHPDPSKVKPASHARPGFGGRLHGREAAFARQQCESCHSETSCDKCHRGQDRRVIHRADFRLTHGREALRADKNCTLCHESGRFCISCHQGRKGR